MKKNNKGFTLAELLIVVAIIAVLVAIAIPVFNAQLEKSRDSVTASNARAKYAEAAAQLLSGDITANTNGSYIYSGTLDIKGQQSNKYFDDLDLPFSLDTTTSAAGVLDAGKASAQSIQFIWTTNASGYVGDRPTLKIIK